MPIEIPAKYKEVLKTVRTAYGKSGAIFIDPPEELGVNKHVKTKRGQIHLSFDDDVPQVLYTPAASFDVAGGHMRGDTKKFMRRLKREFNVEVVKPRRSPQEEDDWTEFHYQIGITGPLLKLTPKRRG